jgi:hypothetical protein
VAGREQWTDGTAAKSEIERLRVDKAAISETASYYLHEVERLQAEIERGVKERC